MRRGFGKRILSLALAAELLCTPLAMARAEDPAQVRVETPLGEEALPAAAPAEDLPMTDPAVDGEPIGEETGLPAGDAQEPTDASEALTDSTDAPSDPSVDITEGAGLLAAPARVIYHLGLSYGQPYNGQYITCYDGYFMQESVNTQWGSAGGATTDRNAMTINLHADADGDYFYFPLPDIGRVPDMELEGLYLYAGAQDDTADSYPAWVDNRNNVLYGWSYDDSTPELYKKISYEVVETEDMAAKLQELKLAAPAGVTSYTLVRFPKSEVTDGFFDLRAPASSSAQQESIPIVARWVPSSDSDLDYFTMEVSGTYPKGSGTEVRTETVTDLYTKPFREAGDADHLAAHDFSVSYLTGLDETSRVTRGGKAFTPAPFQEPEPGTDPAEQPTRQEQHYYLRVEEEQDSLTLRFLTKEPNYKYHITENGGGESPVTVTASFAGRNAEGEPTTLDLPVALTYGWDGDNQPFLPQPLPYAHGYIPQNSVDLPARGQWTVSDIPLRKVSEASNANADPFNTITVTVKSPSGERESVYVFHVERLMTAQAALGYGNTPAGMIMRDVGAPWSGQDVAWDAAYRADMDPREDWVAYNKACALNYFRDKKTFADMPISLSGELNQNGAIYMGEYSPSGWTGVSVNPDLDPGAVVAYQDAALDDPGVSFVDSEGRSVVFGQGAPAAYRGCVTRTLELRTAPALTVDSYGSDGVRCLYNVDENGKPRLLTAADVVREGATVGEGTPSDPDAWIDPAKAAQVLSRSTGSDPVDLRGLIVLPGVYTAVYTFHDPVSGDSLTAERTFVVMPTPGDVDMDGAVTSADAAELELNADHLASGSAAPFRLLRYRVCHMGGGSTPLLALQSVVGVIRRGFQPILGNTGGYGYSDYMYLPLPYTAPAGDDYHARRTWDDLAGDEDPAASKPKLRLDFLSVEQGTWVRDRDQEGREVEVYTTGITGPWYEPPEGQSAQGVSIVANDPTTGEEADYGTGDVFWMGVYVEDPGTMTGPIKDLSISLVYDSEYVRPMSVYGPGEGGSYDNALSCWQATTLVRYNMREGSKDSNGQPRTIFSGLGGYDYTYSESVYDRPYMTHYSKVKGDLEQAYTDAYGHLESGKLKEVVFSLQGKVGGTLAQMDTGYLLVLPFQMIRHPDERMVGASAQLIELSAGMRDFSLVLEPSQARSQGIFELFSAQPRTAAGTTYAFSAQQDIYGNSTQNIRRTLTYDDANGLVPIGKDNTVRVTLTDADGNNAVYDEPFTISRNAFFGGRVTAGDLPIGMELDGSVIRGTPTQVRRDAAGEVIGYDFTIKGQPYRIIVEPKVLHYRARSEVTYYGESEFRGASDSDLRRSGSRDFTFTYDRADLADRDREEAKRQDAAWSATTTDASGNEVSAQGTAQELESILLATGVEYVPPVFQAQTAGEQAITPRSPAGRPDSPYRIVPENIPMATNYQLVYDADTSGLLTIEPRPVWVDHLVVHQDRSGASIYNDESGQNLSLVATEEKAGDELIFLAFDDSRTLKPDNTREFEGLPLTGPARLEGDVLSLEYGGEYMPNDADKAYVEEQEASGGVAYRFLLTASSKESRPLHVTWLGGSFGGEDARNYALMGKDTMIAPDDCKIFGTVVRRGVKEIAFMQYPAILKDDEADAPPLPAYYGDPINHDELFVQVTRGSADTVADGSDKKVGEFVYNSGDLLPMELHYNWVSPQQRDDGLKEENLHNLVGTNWDPTLPEEDQDLFSYSKTTMLTPAMDGYYLCAAVRMYESNPDGSVGVKYIKAYSEYPVTVRKKTISLTAQPMHRYYGEDNGAMSYTYSLADMIPEDQNALRDWVDQNAGTVGTEPLYSGQELEDFFTQGLRDAAFVPPTMEASTQYTMRVSSDTGELEPTGTAVDKRTPVGGREFYILLYGGASTNYNFSYIRPKVVNNVVSGTETELVTGPNAYGFSKMTMVPRPIVISDIYADDHQSQSNFQTIYADTKNLLLQGERAGKDRIRFTLPDTDDQYTYFYRYGSGSGRVALGLTYTDRNAVVEGDDIGVTYSVRFMCDPGHAGWYGFDNNYYDIPTLSASATPGTMQKDVAIGDMVLTGAASANYELVYNKSENAMQRAPDSSVAKNYNNPDDPRDTDHRYLIHGTGTVTLRKIAKLALESPGQTNYTYGDTYAPYVNNTVTGTAMTVTVRYDTSVDEAHKRADPENKDLENNISSEPVRYKTRNGVSTFTQRGFVIYYQKPGQTTDQAVAANQTLDPASPMIPDEHNGAKIFITGKRRAEDELVTSETSAYALRVDKKALTFSVRDAHRFYGEELHLNEGDTATKDYIGTRAFTYTIPTAQLALRDREKLAQLKGVAVNTLPAQTTEADLQALQNSGWSMGLITPTYSGDPGTMAPLNRENWGMYPISITPHDMKNYTVTGLPGALYIYPRPIQVTGVVSSESEPIYTIFNATTSNDPAIELDPRKVVLERTNVYNGTDALVQVQTCSDDIARRLPLSGPALAGQDELIFHVKLWFNPQDGWDLSGVADMVKTGVQVTFRGVQRTDAAKNYNVTNISTNESQTQVFTEGVWGAVKIRPIDEIYVVNPPKLAYTYGETLDLRDLKVIIRLQAHPGETIDPIEVSYTGPNDFRTKGLYINYWDPADPVPGGKKPYENDNDQKDATTTTAEEDEARLALPRKYRRADWGDHLTIAPTHDTQQFLNDPTADPNDPLQRPFAANGKYLIISAFQMGQKQHAVTPKIIGTRVMTSGGESYEGEPTPITVKPRQLHYTVRAEDKTYDGTRQAAGTLTLTDVFDANVQVKTQEIDGEIQQVSELIRDVVYVPMGADYEGQGDNAGAAGYRGYLSKLSYGEVAFTTGAYRPNGESPLEANGRIDWTRFDSGKAYAWAENSGLLTFTFANPNVHYLEEGESRPKGEGTGTLAEYWALGLADYWGADQAHNDAGGHWDYYGSVCAMPVEVFNMNLAGPDAANYTWASDGSADPDMAVTMSQGDAQLSNQAAVPYATIHRANRDPIQALAAASGAKLSLPQLQLDEHTNVVRMFYDQEIEAMGDNNNILGSVDAYSDELHFEYALYYEDQDRLFTQWAGAAGDRSYQDTLFFGGEFVDMNDPANAAYLPDFDHLPLREDVNEETMVYKGQRYGWAEADTGVSTRTHRDTGETLPGRREDAGVIRDMEAYPGGGENAEMYYTWYYDLYNWGPEGAARTALPRDTVFYPLVRLSGTHNYNPSGVLTGDADGDGLPDVSTQDLDAAQKAMARLAQAQGAEGSDTDALNASANVFTEAAAMSAAARALSESRVNFDAQIAEDNKFPETGRPPLGKASAVKTFRQRLDLISAEWERSKNLSDNQEYLIKTLEAVWFTDTMVYPDVKNMNAVVYNDPTRYFNYFWDPDRSAEIRFNEGDKPLDLGQSISVKIHQRQSDGTIVERVFTYNPETTVPPNTARLYVQVTQGGGHTVRSMEVLPSVVHARLGDAPYQLRLSTYPAKPTNRTYTWTSSDPSVATVDQMGRVTFRGEGKAIITVTSENGLRATAVVIVSPLLPVALPGAEGTEPIFNFHFAGPWALLDGIYAFRPKVGMTRGELVTLLDMFLNPTGQWKATQELAYIDVTGREKYYEALKRLTGAGVVTGIPGGCFAGDQLATRAEFVTMLSRMLRLNVPDTKGMAHAFADTDEKSTWAYAYIDALAKAGVIRGVGDGQFAPNRVITREETAAIIARLLTTQLDEDRKDLLIPSDMTPENWSYPAVLRAVNTVAFPD